MENKINVFDFIDGYKNAEDKTAYINSTVKVLSYLGYADKVTAAKNIAEASYYAEDETGARYVKADSPARYVMYIFFIYRLYTNIDYPLTDLIKVYDALEENGITQHVLSMIPEKELESFTTILEIVCDDLITNEYEIHSYITNKFNRLLKMFDTLTKPLLSSLADKINTLDADTVASLISEPEKIFDKIAKR